MNKGRVFPLPIENDLNNARVDDDAHDLLYSMVLYYKKHAMIDDKDFILYLPDEQKEVFEKVLAMNKKKDKLLDFDLKHNELLVKEYPTLLIIQNEKDSDAPKTRENISDMINLKRSIVKVNRKKKTGGA